MEAWLKFLLLLVFFFLYPALSQRRLPESERWGLLELRSSLGIKAIDWNKKANPCLNWTGIECMNGHVTRIMLSGLRRTREGKLNARFAVDSISNFPLLSTFSSSGFSLPGSIPEWLGQRLSNLEVLDLSSSSIYGSIPSSLRSLSRLSSLNLSENSITGIMPPALGELFYLTSLDLSKNLITGEIPKEISALGNLTNLDLSSNFLSGGIPLDFGSLFSLKLLNLSNNSLSGSIPAQLGKLSRLVELDLGYNSLMGLLPVELQEFRSLRKLIIGNNELEGSLSNGFFQRLPQLEYLVLSRNYFNGKLPDAIWSNSPLKYIDVSENYFTGVLPRFLAFSNVTGAVFNFSNNLFYGKLISGTGELQILDVSDNYFEGSAPTNTRSTVILSDNCLSYLPGQRNSDVCLRFYMDRGLSFGNDSAPEPLEPRLLQPPNSRKRRVYIMIGAFGGVGFIMILVTGSFLLLKTCTTGSGNRQRGNTNVRPVHEGGIDPHPKVSIDFSGLGESFTYDQMLLATCNFSNSNLIKHGHSGDLFHGTLDRGDRVVIKRVDFNSLRKELFMSELDLYSKVNHRRLVHLVGHCLEDENEKILVYKYMPNGDLSNSLHILTNTAAEAEDIQSLDWITRLKIATGAAEALTYLHHECHPPVVHRDIQASSILLDDKYEVRLGSMGEACFLETSNPQNMIGRLLWTPTISGKRPSGSSSVTCAYDVHCFGKVLLELVTGRIGMSRLNDSDTNQWLESSVPFINIHDKELLVKIIDQSLIIDEDLLEEVWAVAIVAKSCLNPKASRRPSMIQVLKALENPFKVVRGENFSSERLSASSSRQSWTAAFFGSWQRSSSDSSNMSSQTNKEIIGSLRRSDRVGSRGSGANEYSSSHKRSSSDIFPEPTEMQDVERQDNSSRL